MNLKRCGKCKLSKELLKFRNDKYHRYGKTNTCKECLDTFTPREAKCLFCRSWFTQTQSNYKFCMGVCRVMYRRKVKSLNNYPLFPYKKCKFCRSLFPQKKPSHMFCNPTCQSKYKRKNKSYKEYQKRYQKEYYKTRLVLTRQLDNVINQLNG